jgi:UDP-glucose 4-epimerase
MATYAITGSSGYIGTRMTRWLLERDARDPVLGFDVRPPRVSHPRLEHHELDVRDPRLGELIAGREVDALLHFAFIVDPLYDEREMTDIDLGGTRNVLDAVLAARIPYLLATSSTTAYGALPDNPVPLAEEHPTRAPRAFVYAHDKKLMDEMLRDFAAAHPEVAVCIVRPCIVLGPTVSNYIAATMLDQPVGALIDGQDPPFQFIHEDDLARMLGLCVEKRATGIFNAVGAGQVTPRQVARLQGKRSVSVPHWLVRSLLWGVQRTRLLPFSMPPGILEYYRWPWVASGERARRELGFEPSHDARQVFDIVLRRKDEILAAYRSQMAQRARR